MNTPIIISVDQLKKAYGEKIVLDVLSFQVNEGSIFALLGENGAGKTTTVQILSTLIRSDAGIAKIAGYDCGSEKKSVRKLISLTGQFTAVDELLTGEENMHMMARLNHLRGADAKQQTQELLEKFDLIKVAKRPVKTYSGGLKRRLDIAISLLGSPKIVFLDEPTTGLDPISRMNMWRIIKDLANNGVTIFLTTQYLEEADQLANHIAVLNQGRIVAEGSSAELKRLVGEEKVVFQFENESDFAKAVEHVGIGAFAEKSELRLSVNTDGSGERLRVLLNDLHHLGVEPASVQFRKPTLDDVFMKMISEKKKEVVSL